MHRTFGHCFCDLPWPGASLAFARTGRNEECATNGKLLITGLQYCRALGLPRQHPNLTAVGVQVLSYARDRKHIYPLWCSGIANQIMWWTYVKAFWRGVASASGSTITFKTTVKGASK